MAENQSTTVEMWRPVVGYEGFYSVSSLGRVRSERRDLIMKPGLAERYLHVVLSRNGKGHTKTVHTIVAAAFLGPRPKGAEVNHRDGNRMNNAADNLEYCTASENTQHAVRLGIKPRGEKHGRAKLTDANALAVIEEIKAGLPVREIAARFGISRTTVWKLRTGYSWKHLQ